MDNPSASTSTLLSVKDSSNKPLRIAVITCLVLVALCGVAGSCLFVVLMVAQASGALH